MTFLYDLGGFKGLISFGAPQSRNCGNVKLIAENFYHSE